MQHPSSTVTRILMRGAIKVTFYSYMIRGHKGLKTETDWLANEMRIDREHFPKNSSRKLKAWKKLILSHMKEHPELYAGCMDAFEECWEEYEKCEKSRLSKSS